MCVCEMRVFYVFLLSQFFFSSALELQAHCIHLTIRKACRLFFDARISSCVRTCDWWNGVGALVCFCFVWFLFQISCVYCIARELMWFFFLSTNVLCSILHAGNDLNKPTFNVFFFRPIHKFLIYIKFRSKPHRSSLAAHTNTLTNKVNDKKSVWHFKNRTASKATATTTAVAVSR